MTSVAHSWLVMMAMVVTTLAACSDNLHPGAELPSPDGRYVASFFGISGGGAAGWSRQYVGIRRADRTFDRRERVFEMSHGYEVCLVWKSDTELLVEYPAESTVYASEHEVVLDQPLEVAFRSRSSSGGILLERVCGGCLAQVGAAGSRWSGCEVIVPPTRPPARELQRLL